MYKLQLKSIYSEAVNKLFKGFFPLIYNLENNPEKLKKLNSERVGVETVGYIGKWEGGNDDEDGIRGKLEREGYMGRTGQ